MLMRGMGGLRMRMIRLESSLKSRRRGRGRVLWFSGLTALSLTALLFFQNCTQPTPIDGDGEWTSQAEKLEFSYDATIDQMSYMSCSNVDLGGSDKSAFFSFRLGAYRDGGLRLTDSFLTTMEKKPAEQQIGLLSASPANTTTILQASLRVLNNYQSLMTSSGTPRQDEDYQNMLEPLGTQEMSYLLVNNPAGSRIRHVRNGTVFGSRLEASLFFMSSPVLTEQIRNFLRNDGLLALTYTHVNSGGGAGGGSAATGARSPADVVEGSTVNPNRSVFGRGFGITFRQPNVQSLYAQFPTVVLSAVNEVNLLNSSDRTGLGTWTCPTQLQFRIVRSQDLAATGANCRAIPDPASPTFEQGIVRNSLRYEDWFIDFDNHCIVPKKAGNGCYGTISQVKYTMGDTCTPGVSPACVAYASVCYRTN